MIGAKLVTLAAARRLRSSYCMLAHGSVLAERFMDPETMRAFVADPTAAGLDAVDGLPPTGGAP